MKEEIFFTSVNEIGKTHEPIQKFGKGDRITPTASATSVVEGTIAVSEADGRLCYTKKDKNGVARWYRFDTPYDFKNVGDIKLYQTFNGNKGRYNGNVDLVWKSTNGFFTFVLIVERINNFYYYTTECYFEDVPNGIYEQIDIVGKKLIETKQTLTYFATTLPEYIRSKIREKKDIYSGFDIDLDASNDYFLNLNKSLQVIGILFKEIAMFQRAGWYKDVFGDLPTPDSSASANVPDVQGNIQPLQDVHIVPKRPIDIFSEILSENSSKNWAKQPTADAVKKAIYSKRKTEAQKVTLIMAFGTLERVDNHNPRWSQFLENATKIGYDRPFGNEPVFYLYTQRIPDWEIVGKFDDRVDTIDFINTWLFPSFGEDIWKSETRKDELWQDWLDLNSNQNAEIDTQDVTTPVVSNQNDPQPKVFEVTHQKEVVSTPLSELENEYADVMFLISITPSIEFTKILELKKIAKELKLKIDQLSLEEKDKMLKENNIFDELFKASSIQPKHRYDLKPDPNGFAPDGTPTKLPKAIYELTQTDDFEKWFGDFQLAYNFKNSPYTEVPCSVVKNVHYEPQIVFHGTGFQFSYFDFSKFPIMYFAENIAYAEWFAEQKGAQQGHNGYVYPFMLNIRNPLDLTHFGIDQITPQEFVDWMYLQTGLEADELKINPAILSSNNPTWAWVYLRNGEEMLNVIRELNLFDGIIYYENNPPIDTTAPNYKTKGFIIFEPYSAKIVDPERHSMLLPSMRSFYFKKGGRL